ncbi:hypothetical protein [Streptomyces sp. CFMR 7]|uniref:hypothetical protein n=1 Tax=Streptomyces sp. CFMR 7 TaxID=1649184 RepID=UPI0011A77E70|nr:hypothetical protein [Streptomyces sp. CFMR 7]
MTSSPTPTMPEERTVPTAADATATATRLTRALRSCGVFLERVRPDSVSGRPVVAVSGYINIETAERLAEKLEMAGHRPSVDLQSLRPPGTLPVRVEHTEVQVGDYLPLDDGCHLIVNMRAAGRSSRTLELQSHPPFVMTHARMVFRSVEKIHGLISP